MKRKIILIGLALVFIVGMFSGCGQKEPDISKKYIVVSDSVYGIKFKNECYSSGGTFKEKLEWVEGRSYAFKYDVYYEDNDQPTGESGGVYDVSGEPGSYFIRAYVNLGKGNKEYDIYINIDPPITWELETEGTVEYTENERYVYRYDESKEYLRPIPKLYFDGKRPSSDDKFWDSVDWSWDTTYKESGAVCRPKDVGVYEVIYKIDYYWTNSEGSTSKYKFSQSITIEIIE